MNRRVLVLVLACAATACGKSTADPCSGRQAPCLSVRVNGNVQPDQVQFWVAGQTRLSPPTAATEPFSLPVDVALLLPGTATGNVTLTARGLRAGAALADDMQPATLNGEGYGHVTVNLVSGRIDGGAEAGPGDGATDGPTDLHIMYDALLLDLKIIPFDSSLGN